MICNVLLADLLDDIVGAPEFAVDEDDAFGLRLCAEILIRNHFLIQTVADLGLVVVAAVAERDLIKGINDLTLVICQLAVEEIILQLRGAVIGAGIEIEALLGCGARCSTVHTDADACAVGRLSLLKDGDMCRALPLLAALGVVCGMCPGLHRIALGSIVDLALDIDAGIVIEEIIRVGHEGDDAHLLLDVAAGIADEIRIGCDIALVALCVHGDCTDDHRLADRLSRCFVAVCDIGFCCIDIRLRGFIIDLDRTGEFFGAGIRIAAVGRIVNRAALICGERQIEAGIIEAAALGELRCRNDQLLCDIGRICLACGKLGNDRKLAAAVRHSCICGIVIHRRELNRFDHIARLIRENDGLAALGKAEFRALHAAACLDTAVNDQMAVCRDHGPVRNHIKPQLCCIIGERITADCCLAAAGVIQFNIVIELTVRCSKLCILGANLIHDNRTCCQR